MSMLPTKLERIDDKISALQTALIATLPSTRQIDLGFIPYTDRTPDELYAGCWNIVAAGEGDYHNGMGMAAKEGTLQVQLVGHIAVEDDAVRASLQQAEIDMAEEIKAFVRLGLIGMTLVLERIEQSRLLEHPYGWVVAFLDVRPPAQNTY